MIMRRQGLHVEDGSATTNGTNAWATTQNRPNTAVPREGPGAEWRRLAVALPPSRTTERQYHGHAPASECRQDSITCDRIYLSRTESRQTR